MIDSEIEHMQQGELLTFFVYKRCDGQLLGFNDDFVFSLMLNVNLAGWFLLLQQYFSKRKNLAWWDA